MVTNDIFVSFLNCKRKAFLRAAGTSGHPTEIETVLLDLGQTYRRQALEAFLSPYPAQDVLQDPPGAVSLVRLNVVDFGVLASESATGSDWG